MTSAAPSSGASERAEAVRDLYVSVQSSQNQARRRLLRIAEIELRHSAAPLAVLADLAVEGWSGTDPVAGGQDG